MDQKSDDEDKIINSPVDLDVPIKIFERLGMIAVRISVLCDYINVVNTTGNQLRYLGNRKNIEMGQKPAFQLYEYLILELRSFYDYVRKSDKLIKKIKESPNVEPQELIRTIKKNNLDENKIDEYVELIKKIRADPELKFPTLPEYLKEIDKFRDVIVAHLDKHEKLKSRMDFIAAYNFLFEDDRIEKTIIPDFNKYYEGCLVRFKEFINRSPKA